MNFKRFSLSLKQFLLTEGLKILETKYHCCKSYKLKSFFANLRLFYYPALMHVKILAPEFGAAGYKDLDSSSSLYAEIPQEMI